MKIQLLHIGKNSKNLFEKAESEYLKRLKRYVRIDAQQIAPLKASKKMSIQEVTYKEGQLLLSKVPQSNQIILMDEKGDRFDSVQFARLLQNYFNKSSDISFLIGGANGFHDEVKSQANQMISLSSMTFPHHLARVVFLEQLYRAYTILNNEPYHNE